MNQWNKEILRLAVPSIVTNVTVPLLGRVDLAMMVYSTYRKDITNYSRAIFRLYYQIVYRNDAHEDFDVRHLEGKLWEIRAKGKDGIARSLYVTASGKRIVIVRCFVKKSQKTPEKELKMALQRAEEVE